MNGSRKVIRAVVLLTILACTQIVGCGAATILAGAGTAMVAAVQGNQVLAPFFDVFGL
jgi:hypothetical protein